MVIVVIRFHDAQAGLAGSRPASSIAEIGGLPTGVCSPCADGESSLASFFDAAPRTTRGLWLVCLALCWTSRSNRACLTESEKPANPISAKSRNFVGRRDTGFARDRVAPPPGGRARRRGFLPASPGGATDEFPKRIVCETLIESQQKQWLARPEFLSQIEGMEIGYARVSTGDQNLDLQEQALTAAGAGRIFTDRVSGAATSRPGLDKALGALTAGDVLVVWRLDRLGRSLSHLIALVDDLGSRRIGFRSLTEGIDTTSAQGNLVFHMMGALAQFERALISERTLAGLKAAKARGSRLGRKPALIASQVEHARKLMEAGERPADVARSLNVGRATLYRALRAQPPQVSGLTYS